MSAARPKLAAKARLRFDRHTKAWILVYPERGLTLSESATAIVKRLDGTQSIPAISAELAREFGAETAADHEAIADDVVRFVESLAKRGLLDDASSFDTQAAAATVTETTAPTAPRGETAIARGDSPAAPRPTADVPRPYTLIAELTYRCPLACPYCSNPVDLKGARAHGDELDTDAWCRVFDEAEALGVVQLHLTGGEPLARKDLEAIAAHARTRGLYTNLVTSGVPLTQDRLASLVDAGIDHVQVSVQAADAAVADRIAGYEGHAHKIDVMRWVKARGLPLTMNTVLHAENVDTVDAIVALAEDVGADRLELANTQYLGWALANRDVLLPTRARIDAAAERAAHHRARLEGRIDVLFVKPDYFRSTPRACMDGWARRFVHVVPDGRVLPCHAAASIPSLHFESVRDRSLAEIWSRSEALVRYRGDAWMPDPCRSCEHKHEDFGGCRCQAFALLGDPAATDPVCHLSPHHARIDEARKKATAKLETRRYLYRGR